jgi:putative heme-binding domain-containing protein
VRSTLRAVPATVPDPFFSTASAAELVRRLADPNPWWRETAQRLLIERGDRAARGPLAELVRHGATPPARLHALYTLDGLAALDPEDVRWALRDASFGVRLHALRLAERWLDSRRPLLDQVLGMTQDQDPNVRLQVALTLGETRDVRALDALARLAAEHGGERWMASALASSAAETADALISRLGERHELNPGALAVLGMLAETVGARRDDAAVARVLERLAVGDGPDGLRAKVLDGLLRGLGRGQLQALRAEGGVRALERLLADPSASVARQAVRIAGLLRLGDSPALRANWEAAAQTALDPGRPLAARLEAVTLLDAAPWERQQALTVLIDSRQPTELQLAVVAALACTDQVAVADALLANWPALLPKVREAIIDALFARRDRLPRLLDAVERGVVSAAELSVLRREQLVEHDNPSLRRRARTLLANRVSDDRAGVIRRYEPALTLPRDPRRGEAVFERTCSRCHRLNGKGFEVGPDLSAVRARPDATLLLDVLDPSGTLAPGYTVYTVATRDGRVYTGLLAGDSATSVTLRNAAEPQAKGGPAAPAQQTILRKDIDAMRASAKSLMPDGLEKELTPQDLADLLGFLRQALGPVAAPGVVLFDGDHLLLDAFTTGTATATLTAADKVSGKVALHLTAGQRTAPRVPGWVFRIVEDPRKGEGSAPQRPQSAGGYRYLRFAWKSAGAHGVLVELAADGSLPPTDKPVRRYSAGKNTSGWQALEISPAAPAAWTVVTVDLWKDFGTFTLTGLALTALGGPALFDRIELLQALEDTRPERALKK